MALASSLQVLVMPREVLVLRQNIFELFIWYTIGLCLLVLCVSAWNARRIIDNRTKLRMLMDYSLRHAAIPSDLTFREIVEESSKNLERRLINLK